MKTLQLNESTFGGKILKRIKELCEDKKANGFEIITIVKGLTNSNWISLIHLPHIKVSKVSDTYMLHYPSKHFDNDLFIESIEQYSDEDKGKAIELLALSIEHLTCLSDNKLKLVLFSSGKQISNIDLSDLSEDIL